MTSRQASLDPYLLRVLCLLIAERSVSRTALRLHQSQPAISAALRKLRETFDDPLLVREKGGMVPTERALQLLPDAEAALAALDKLTRPPAAFSPFDSHQRFRLGAPDYLAPVFMTNAVARFCREAPRAQLEIQALGPEFDVESALAEGELDVVIGNWPEPPERMHLSMLLEDEIVCLVSSRHPLARRGMSRDQYLAARHVIPLPYSMSQRGLIDSQLASLRERRHAVVEVQSFTLAPYLLPDSDLVFTTSRHFARFYANLLPLSILPAPIDFPPMRFYQLWHERSHQAPPQRWLRRLLGEAGRQVQ